MAAESGGWWIVLFAVLIVTLLVASTDARPARLAYGAFTLAVVSSWASVSGWPSRIVSTSLAW